MSTTPRLRMRPYPSMTGIVMEACSTECYCLWQAAHVAQLIPPEVTYDAPANEPHCIACCWCGRTIWTPDTCQLHTLCPDVAPLLTLPVLIAIRHWQRREQRPFPDDDHTWQQLEAFALELHALGTTCYTPAGILAGIDTLLPPL